MGPLRTFPVHRLEAGASGDDLVLLEMCITGRVSQDALCVVVPACKILSSETWMVTTWDDDRGVCGPFRRMWDLKF